jgi:D-alanyl-D-alanine carboxypeptidase
MSRAKRGICLPFGNIVFLVPHQGQIARKDGVLKLQTMADRRPVLAKILTLVLAVALLTVPQVQQALARPQIATIAVDARNGRVIMANDPDGLRHPASLTKMMTLYILFQELKAGRVSLATPFTMSNRAAHMQPSKMGIRPGASYTVEQAIKSLIIKSANDVAASVGENLSGSESQFAVRMTQTARDIGMSRTTYLNASGLPNPGQITTARDQATLGLRLMRDFPQYYPYFRLQGFNFNGRTIRTHNRLVGKFNGTDGIKTGYTATSGYNLVTSTRRGDSRLVGVVLGSSSASGRNAYMMNMLTKAFPKASTGRTIAAYAGSSKGAVDPIAMASLASTVTAAGDERQPDPKDQVELAAAAADASSTDSEGDDETDALPAASEGPKVLEARVSSDADWTIQVGVFASKNMALATLDSLKAKRLPQLAGKQAQAQPLKKGNRMQYRARFTGFDQGSAEMACDEMTKRKLTCLAISPKL